MMQIVAGQQLNSLKMAPRGAFFITGGLCLIVMDVSHANGELAVSVEEAVQVGIGLILLGFQRFPNLLTGELIERTDRRAGDAGVKTLTLRVSFNHMAHAQDVEGEAVGDFPNNIVDPINQAAVSLIFSWLRGVAKFHKNGFHGVHLSLVP